MRISIALLLVALSVPVYAQDTAKKAPENPPALSDVARLELALPLKDMQIAQLQAQAAQRDFEAAKAKLLELVKALDRPGYELDIQTMTYKHKPPERKDTP